MWRWDYAEFYSYRNLHDIVINNYTFIYGPNKNSNQVQYDDKFFRGFKSILIFPLTPQSETSLSMILAQMYAFNLPPQLPPARLLNIESYMVI